MIAGCCHCIVLSGCGVRGPEGGERRQEVGRPGAGCARIWPGCSGRGRGASAQMGRRSRALGKQAGCRAGEGEPVGSGERRGGPGLVVYPKGKTARGGRCGEEERVQGVGGRGCDEPERYGTGERAGAFLWWILGLSRAGRQRSGERVSSGCGGLGGLMGRFMPARGPKCSGPLGSSRAGRRGPAQMGRRARGDGHPGG